MTGDDDYGVSGDVSILNHESVDAYTWRLDKIV
jgi:hypothetical protein